MTAPSCVASKFEKVLADRVVPHMSQSQSDAEIKIGGIYFYNFGLIPAALLD